MAINCIPYQPIDFCDQSLCYDEAFCLRVEPTDVNKVQIELGLKFPGNELIADGDFSVAGTWNMGTGWTITGGQAVAAGATGNLDQALVFVVGKYYWMQFTLSEWQSGVIDTPIGSTNINGTYQGVFLATSTSIIFDPTPNFTGKLDNVSAFDLEMIGYNIIDCETGDTIVYNGDGAVGITYLETDISAAGDFQGQSAVGVAMITFDWDADPLSDIPVPSCFCICIVPEPDEVICSLRSQPICIATTHPGTVFFKGENEDNFIVDQQLINFINFPTMEVGFRAEAKIWHPHPEENLLAYQFSNFNRETTHFENAIVWDLVTEELPYPQHFALWGMMGMDQFTIDGVEYFRFGESVAPDWTKGTDYVPVEAQVVKDGTGMMNANC